MHQFDGHRGNCMLKYARFFKWRWRLALPLRKHYRLDARREWEEFYWCESVLRMWISCTLDEWLLRTLWYVRWCKSFGLGHVVCIIRIHGTLRPTGGPRIWYFNYIFNKADAVLLINAIMTWSDTCSCPESHAFMNQDNKAKADL